MKNYLQYILLAAFLLSVSACKDDKDDPVISTSKIKIGTLTVVTAVKDDKAVEKNTSFFQAGDVVDFQYSISGSSTASFNVEKTSDSWGDVSETLYYKDIYLNGKDPQSFIGEFGTNELTADQSTDAKFHNAHYLKGDAYVKSTNANILVDSMLNQHVLVIVKIVRSNNWPDIPEFHSIVNENALQIHTTGESKIKPLYNGSHSDSSVYSAVVPANMIPAAGSTIFTLNDQPIAYTFVGGGSVPTKGQTLVVTAIYNYGETPKVTAITKDAWDVTGNSKYGYPVITEIASIEDLNAFAASVSAGVDYKDKTVTLKTYLELNGETINPIGTQDWPFNGTFLGQGYSIDNFRISTTSANSALFGSIGVDGTVREVSVGNFYVETDGSYAAALAGSNYGYIVSCFVADGTVVGGNYVGGVAGYNDGTIVACSTVGTDISSQKQTNAIAGGIAGFNYRNIISCLAVPKGVQVLTRSDNKFGAVVGENSNAGNIDRCYWDHESLPPVGYSIKIPEQADKEERNKAIGDYNADKKEGDARYCKILWGS